MRLPSAGMMPGRSFRYDGHPDSHVEQTVNAFLALHDDFLPELHDNIAAGAVVHTPKALRAYNADHQRDLDGVKATMKAVAVIAGLGDPELRRQLSAERERLAGQGAAMPPALAVLRDAPSGVA
jgi:hypothetical protein